MKCGGIKEREGTSSAKFKKWILREGLKTGNDKDSNMSWKIVAEFK